LCRARLSAYKVPARFIRVDHLELTASGKIRRV
jgi:acyl-CoA synthetase (AMP-forming)/AMP-acid ligase II